MAPELHQLRSVGELQARLEAERAGRPFLLFRDDRDRQQLIALPDDGSAVPIGRGPDCAVQLAWDAKVSRVHAVLEPVAGAWTVLDDGLSSNGTFVNGARVAGRRRLDDGDVVGCGSVTLQFRSPSPPHEMDKETVRVVAETQAPGGLSQAQRRVLVALCRPLRDSPYATAATNKQIAAELHLSVDAVKTHLRRVAETLEVEDLPQNQKRAALAWKALSTGVVSPRELLDG